MTAGQGGLLLTGGGTGGHVFPALAVAEALRHLDPELPLHYVGTSDRFEGQAVPAAGLPFHPIRSAGLSGGPWGALKALALATWGSLQAVVLLRRLRPRAVLATGGFVCAPVLVAARLLGIPYALAEQNVVPGKVNRWFARQAAFVALSFRASEARFPAGTRCRLLGNPLRQQVLLADGPAWRARQGLGPEALVLVASGGSQGAASINEGLARALPTLMEAVPSLHVWWATGAKEAEARGQEAQAWAGRVRVGAFFDDLPQAMAGADLVVGRAGATSLAELTALGRPAVLVPYPHAGAHQAANAAVAWEQGAVVVVEDAQAREGGLGPVLVDLLHDPERLRRMAMAAKALGLPEAARDLAQALRDLPA